MIRITRITDHGIILLTHFALIPLGIVFNARDLAGQEEMSLPMVSKILKMLAAAGLLESHRGVKGGYSLAREANSITLLEIITAMEGPVGMTECTAPEVTACERASFCRVRPHWEVINTSIRDALKNVTLRDVAVPARAVATPAVPATNEIRPTTPSSAR